jgi:REP element-mobilizing transposase RayT
MPREVIELWQLQLKHLEKKYQAIVLARRIEKYLDQGHGDCFLRDARIATIVQDSLLKFDAVRYNLFSWVVMPNHSHSLLTRFDDWTIERLIHSHKSYTAHEANKVLNRSGQFWLEDYFDRYIRNEEHFRNAVSYIENNPVKAGFCSKPSDWPFSSAWFREHSR